MRIAVIDAHHHVWDLSVRDQPWLAGAEMAAIRRTFTLDDLRPSARAAGVDATVVVQTVTIAAEPARLMSGPGGGRLAGIRHQVQSDPDPDWLRRPDVIRGLRAVAEAGLSYDLVVLPHQLPAAAHAAAAVPDLTLVLDHAGKPRIAGGDLGS